jgi:hypothetical protein
MNCYVFAIGGDMFDELCGCGKPVRYSIPGGEGNGSCNKRLRCLTYEEQSERLKSVTADMLKYRSALDRIIAVNAMDYEYRAWAKAAIDT